MGSAVGQMVAVAAAEEAEEGVVALVDAVGVYQTAYQWLFRFVSRMANLLEGTSEEQSASAEECVAAGASVAVSRNTEEATDYSAEHRSGSGQKH